MSREIHTSQIEDIGSLFLTYSLDPHLKGTVGGPTPNTEFKIIDVPEMNYFSTDKNAQGKLCPRGELLVKGCVMTAYFKNQQQSDETLDKDEFIHTGDIVQLQENGAIKIIDRRTNFFKLAQGEYVAPEKLENIYIRSLGVQEAFVYGDRNESHLVAIIVPSQEYVMKFAQQQNLQGDFAALCKNEQVIKQIQQNLNDQAEKDELLGFEKVKKIYLEPISFVVHGACTPSFKMKRKVAEGIFQNQLKELYAHHKK